eukprot:scaffold65099_cov68-Attheya_sp.AAC.4
MVHSICVPYRKAENESSSSSSIHVQHAFMLELLGDNAVTMPEYMTRSCFIQEPYLNGSQKMSVYKTVYKHQIFHKLERTEDTATL